MNNKKLYKELVKKETELPSILGIIPYSDDYEYTYQNLEMKLKDSKYFNVDNIQKTEESLECNIITDNKNLKMEIYIKNTENLNLEIMNFANKVGDKEIEKSKNKYYYIECMTYFDEDVLNSYHVQLKVLDALVPQKGLLIDLSSFVILSGDWLKITANSNVPPKPTYLYAVHAVYDEIDGEKQYWLHTHGLHRCGCIELELLGIKDQVREFLSVINTVAQGMIERGMVEPEEIITVGSNIEFIWIPWEIGLKKIQKGFLFKKEMLGGMQDRHDGVHDGPSGILFAVKDEKLMNPNVYSQMLKENPVFFITTKETNRMAMLAKERFNHFIKIFDKYKNNDEWDFFVKLGYLVDDYENEEQKEHLWFKVKGIDGNTIDGILINEPYWISRMQENDRDIHNLDKLTDWMIYSPKDTICPDSVYRFYQLYEE